MMEKLQQCKSLSDLAELLGYKTSSLSFILYKLPDNKKYFEFEIPKKNGGKRVILAPHPRLKLLQQRLASYLSDCYEKTYLNSEKYADPLAFGFLPKLSIFDNANRHRNKRFILNIDLKDFFPSINFGRVRGFFISNKYFKIDPKVATFLAQIACYKNQLPQGSPCSPIISNFIATQLDARLVSLARKSKCTYSRYADDLTFSTNFKDFPVEFVKIEDEYLVELGESLVKTIESSGFKINPTKVSLQFKRSRQMVTGLVVNKKVNVSINYYRKARSMCNELFRTDAYHLGKKEIYPTINKLLGIVEFIYWIKIGQKFSKIRQLEKRWHTKKIKPPKDNGITKLYKKLVTYKYFVNPPKPVIITEGKTDKIYLKYALQSFALQGKYPKIVKKSNNSRRFENAFNFINIRNKTFQNLFDLPGGASGLTKLSIELIGFYKEKSYTSPLAFKKPIVVVCDNDESGIKFFRTLGRQNEVEVKGENAICFKKFLYAILIPSEKSTVVEELFSQTLLNEKIDGKSFNFKKTSSKLNLDVEYGKSVFANQIVKQQWNKIDFSGFEPLIKEVSEIISEKN